MCVKCVKNEQCDSRLWIILAQSVCCLCHRSEDLAVSQSGMWDIR